MARISDLTLQLNSELTRAYNAAFFHIRESILRRHKESNRNPGSATILKKSRVDAFFIPMTRRSRLQPQ